MTKIKQGITLFLTALLSINIGTVRAEEGDEAVAAPASEAEVAKPSIASHVTAIVKNKFKTLAEGYKQARDNTGRSKVHWYITRDLGNMQDSASWEANQKIMEATIITGSIRIVCIEQGSAHVIRYYDQDTLAAYGKEVGLPFNDTGAPYHDVNADFRTLSQDVPFYYTNMESGMVMKCLLRRDDKGNPFAMFMQGFARIIQTNDVIAVDPQLVLSFFKCFGAFCKVACGAQRGKGKFYYIWSQNARAEFSQVLLTRTFDLLLQEDKRNAIFTEKEQMDMQIHPTQNYPNTLRSWSTSFMDGYNGTDPTRFIYQGDASNKRR